MITRRYWVRQVSAAAAAVGLTSNSPRTAQFFQATGDKRAHLELALQAAKWIAAQRQAGDHGDRYPADPLHPDSVGIDFYNGMPGIVVFFAGLFHATQNVEWLRLAKGAADHLISQMESDGSEIDAGLYTGLAGLGYTFDCLDRIGGGDRYFRAARTTTELLKSRAQRVDGGASWGESWDIISGVAGTGLFLLHGGREWDHSLVGLAAAAGTRLLAVAEPALGGLMWYPGASLQRNYPNFSHGTAGVGFFLATLYQHTNDRRFLDGALKAATYLDQIATRTGDATRIFHQSGGGENRFYLSWCHGPAGTARFFYRLFQITRDRKWLEWVHALTRGIATSGVPEQRTDGFWNNISQCCGNTGIGQYLIDLGRYVRTPDTAAFLQRVVMDTTRRGTTDNAGVRWTQAEHRTQPDNLVAQTGFMQGAAGVGTFLLQLDAFQRGKAWPLPQPDTPFVG